MFGSDDPSRRPKRDDKIVQFNVSKVQNFGCLARKRLSTSDNEHFAQLQENRLDASSCAVSRKRVSMSGMSREVSEGKLYHIMKRMAYVLSLIKVPQRVDHEGGSSDRP